MESTQKEERTLGRWFPVASCMVMLLALLAPITVALPTPPTITTTALPNGTVGTPYTATLTASGGSTPLAWTITQGILPVGVTLNPSGALSGTPLAAATATLTFSVTDTLLQSASKTLSLVINAAPPLAITTTSLPEATAGHPYLATLTAAGGAPPYTWSAAVLPTGLTASSAGQIAGTPIQQGTFTFVAAVIDSMGTTTQSTQSMSVICLDNTFATFCLGDSCPPPSIGTPPACLCPPPSIGNYPDCQVVPLNPQQCPDGQVGTPPLCQPQCDPHTPGLIPPACVPACEPPLCGYKPEPITGNFKGPSISTTGAIKSRDITFSGTPPKEASACAGDMLSDTGTISVVTGEFRFQITPLAIDTAKGPNVDFLMTYRSLSPDATNGALGPGWDYAYGRHLTYDASTQNVIRYDGQGRAYTYTHTTNDYLSPPGFYDHLIVTKDLAGNVIGFTITDRSGTVESYDATGLLVSVQDRNENEMAFTYTSGRLSLIHDAHGRDVTVTYDANNRIATLEDFAGRLVTFTYTGAYLTKVDMPEGVSQSFTYDAGRLSSVRDGENQPYLTNTYGAFDRVSQQDYGLGNYLFHYEPDTQTTTVTDPNRNIVDYTYDARGLIVKTTEYTNRHIVPGAPDSYVTTYQHNDNMERTLIEYPNHATQSFTYDISNTNLLAHGNLLSQTDQAPPTEPTIPLKRTWSYTYEPNYNQLRTDTTPNGNDAAYHPPNGGQASAARYTTTRYYDYEESTLGDLNGDSVTTQAHGNLVTVTYPVVNANGNPNAAFTTQFDHQAASETFTWNDAGQLLTHTDAIGTVEKRTYNTEGPEAFYVSNITQDYGTGTDPLTGQAHLNLNTGVERDDVGNIVSVTDPDGKTTNLSVDDQCRIREVHPPAPAPETHVTYDKNHQVLTLEQQESGNALNKTKADFVYDSPGHTLRLTVNATRPAQAPASTSPTLIVTEYGYDHNGNQIWTRNPNSVAGSNPADVDSTVYDERDMPYTVSHGGVTSQFVTLAANNLVTVTPSLVARVGMATTTTHYTPNGYLADVTDPDGHTTTYGYDGWGRQAYRIDAMGTIFTTKYDANGAMLQQRVWEKTNDPIHSILCARTADAILNALTRNLDPTADCNLGVNDSQAYRMDFETNTKYDERGVPYQVDARYFDEATGQPLTDGPATPGDGYVSSLMEHDAMLRTTRSFNDNLHNATTTYDRLGRVAKATDAVGNTVESVYNKANQVVSTTSRNVSPEALVDALDLVSTMTYDEAGRVKTTADGLGKVVTQFYDWMGNHAATRDEDGNIVKTLYDKAHRPVEESHLLLSGDNGEHTFHAALGTPGSATITATGPALAVTSDPIHLVAATRFGVSISSPTAGTAATVTVTAHDEAGYVATNFHGTVLFGSSDANAVLPAAYSFTDADQGVHDFLVTFKTAGSHELIVADPFGAAASVGVTVSPGSFTKLQILAQGEHAAPGTATGKWGAPYDQIDNAPMSVTVNAVDANWNLVSSTNVVHFTSTDSAAILPPNAALSGGTGTFAVTFGSSGTQTVTVSDVTDSTKSSATTPSIAVNGAYKHYDVTAPTDVLVGETFTVTLTVHNGDNTRATTYQSEAAFGSTDPNAVLPDTLTFVSSDNGQKTTTMHFATSGIQFLSATDVGDNVIQGTSDIIYVHGPAAALAVTAAPTATSGTATSITVTALDALGQIATGYEGTVHLAATDAAATMPSDYTFTNSDHGTHTFTATFKTAEFVLLAATDTGTAAITGNGFTTVLPGAFTKLQLIVPGEVTAPASATGKTGTPATQMATRTFHAVINAMDANWNIVDASDTIGLTTTDTGATLGPNVGLTHGTASIAVTFSGAGSYAVTATDSSDSTKTASTSPSITATALAAHLSIETPTTAQRGKLFDYTVTAHDDDGETNTEFTEQVTFTTTDANHALPGSYRYTMGPASPLGHGIILGYVNVTMEYDADGRVTNRTDGAGHSTHYTLDEFGRTLKETYADGTNHTYTYSLAGDVLTEKDPAGNVIHHTYDDLHRLTATDATLAAGFLGTNHQELAYDGLGRVVYGLDRDTSTPGSDQVTRTRYTSLGTATEDLQGSFHLARILDGLGNAVKTTYPSGRSITATYDSLERPKTIVDDDASTVATMKYLGPMLLERTTPDGAKASWTYDAVGRVKQVKHAIGTTVIAGVVYKYNPAGYVTAATTLHNVDASTYQQLDSLYRLVDYNRGTLNAKERAISTDAADGTTSESWTLDSAGNWDTFSHDDATASSSETRQHNNLNELTSRDGGTTTITYDGNGNLQDDGTYHYEYDYANRLRRVTPTGGGAAVATYAYDVKNRRLASGTTRYAYDGDNLIEIWTGPTVAKDFVYDGAQPVEYDAITGAAASPLPSSTQSTLCPTATPVCPNLGTRTRYYYHADKQGNVLALTDHAGVVLEGYSYDPYGKVTIRTPTAGSVAWDSTDTVTIAGASPLGNVLMYTGQEWDADTGHYYFGARYYDPEMGRFISRDPIGIWGDHVNLGNAYAYVGGAAMDRTDPNGDYACPASSRWTADQCMVCPPPWSTHPDSAYRYIGRDGRCRTDSDPRCPDEQPNMPCFAQTNFSQAQLEELERLHQAALAQARLNAHAASNARWLQMMNSMMDSGAFDPCPTQHICPQARATEGNGVTHMWVGAGPRVTSSDATCAHDFVAGAVPVDGDPPSGLCDSAGVALYATYEACRGAWTLCLEMGVQSAPAVDPFPGVICFICPAMAYFGRQQAAEREALTA